jgi:Holliday junction resolvase
MVNFNEMAQYNKGANAERELLQKLHQTGMAVCRAAGSGKARLPTPDAIALKKGRILAFECKARKGEYLHISIEQLNDLEEWCAMSGAELVIAWKIPNKGWRFFDKEKLKKNGKSYSITKKLALEEGKKLFEILD